MTFSRFSNLLQSLAVLLVSGILCPAFGQGPLPEAPVPSVEPAAPISLAPSHTESPHRFWDSRNRALFIAAATANFADFGVTRANLQHGGQELNPIVRVFGRSTPTLALNFVGESAGNVGLSYFFHKTGHHRLERAISFANIGGSVGAITYGLTHR